MVKRKEECKIIKNEPLNLNGVYEMSLKSNNSFDIKPGQFVNVRIPSKFLARPLSVSFINNQVMDLAYKVVGDGTKEMSCMKPGDKLEILTGLGNGYDLSVDTKRPLLIAGGTGAASIFYLAYELKMSGINPKVILGFKSEDDMFYINEFINLLGDDVTITLENKPNKSDYAYFIKGNLVTDVLDKIDYDYFYACGPKPMLKAVCEQSLTDGEVSLESRMACGIGQCKCCSIETNDGMKTLCNDGPVLKKGLVRWE